MAKSSGSKKNQPNLYLEIIEKIFFKYYRKGVTEILFDREEITEAAKLLGRALPKNLGDVIYTMRYRGSLPEKVVATAANGMEWAIMGGGRAKYAFKQVRFHRLIPRENQLSIKIPDATPEIIVKYALDDEQALLAKVRYNRLIDIFLGITTYSLQNHLRTSVKSIGQIEIDEVYVGVDRHGRHFIVPVQAKGGNDQHGVVQTLQDLQFCAEKYPQLVCRCVSAQFMTDNRIAMFELTLQKEAVKVVEEKHYQLVPSDDITPDDLLLYGTQAKA
jgi:hypothetical protein